MRIWGPFSSLGLGLALAAAIADQLHKAWMIGVLEENPARKIVLAPFFDLVLMWNRGISYGLLKQDSSAGRLTLIAFALAAVLALTFWLARLQTRLSAIGAGLIIGGAVGNVTDRLHYGAVADFFSFHVAGFQWYIFNLADVAIVAGVAGLLYDSFVSSHKSAGKQA
jgi:signal peptidase II